MALCCAGRWYYCLWGFAQKRELTREVSSEPFAKEKAR
jgi:hypothetical protein